MPDSCVQASVVIGVIVAVIIFISAMVGTSLRKLDTDEGNGCNNIRWPSCSGRAPLRAKTHTSHKYLRFLARMGRVSFLDIIPRISSCSLYAE